MAVVNESDSQSKKDQQQIYGVLVLVLIMGGLLWVVLKAARKRK